jgi:hypothetical protein
VGVVVATGEFLPEVSAGYGAGDVGVSPGTEPGGRPAYCRTDHRLSARGDAGCRYGRPSYCPTDRRPPARGDAVRRCGQPAYCPTDHRPPATGPRDAVRRCGQPSYCPTDRRPPARGTRCAVAGSPRTAGPTTDRRIAGTRCAVGPARRPFYAGAHGGWPCDGNRCRTLTRTGRRRPVPAIARAPMAGTAPRAPTRDSAVRAAGGAARTAGRQPITLSIASVAAFHASAGLVPRCSMLLICVEIVSLIVASFGPSTASGMDLASSA